jgi:hypothetical protein
MSKQTRRGWWAEVSAGVRLWWRAALDRLVGEDNHRTKWGFRS